MKYLCLICADPKYMMEHLPEADAAKHFDEYRVFTDGPFTETKELVAGYTLIQAKSREEALEWTKPEIRRRSNHAESKACPGRDAHGDAAPGLRWRGRCH